MVEVSIENKPYFTLNKLLCWGYFLPIVVTLLNNIKRYSSILLIGTINNQKNKIMLTIENFKRVNNDVYGNPRYVLHFPFLNTEAENRNRDLSIIDLYNLAAKRANKIGGKKYRGKDFGGGIVFQSYNIYETIELIKTLVQ